MNIAVVGNGRMGNEIAPLVQERGHTLIGPLSKQTFTKENIATADVVIEFTKPDAAFKNINTCLKAHVPVVCGTTGWLKKLGEIEALAEQENTGFLYASNFSLGVNLFFELTQKLAKLMKPFDEYIPSIEEIHHTNKLDAPSGTALTLATRVLDQSPQLTDWQLKTVQSEIEALAQEEKPSRQGILDITAKRIEHVPGTHSINYISNVDAIEIKHTAFSRKGFALGAVLAAEFLAGKSGIYSMKDVLNLN